MIRTVLFLLLMPIGPFALADEAKETQDKDATIARLLERLDKMEKRMAKLEAALAKSTSVHKGPQVTPPVHKTPQVAPPGFKAPGEPPRHGKPLPPYQPTLPSFSPPAAPQATPGAKGPSPAPKSWKRFYFNDQWYYMVPLDEAESRLSRPGKPQIHRKDGP